MPVTSRQTASMIRSQTTRRTDEEDFLNPVVHIFISKYLVEADVPTSEEILSSVANVDKAFGIGGLAYDMKRLFRPLDAEPE